MNEHGSSTLCGRFLSGLAIGIFASALLACASVPQSTQAPRVELVGLRVLSSTVEDQLFAVSLLIDNLNDFPIPVRSMRFSVRLGGEGVISGEEPNEFTIPALGTTRIEVEVASNSVSSQSRLLAVARGSERLLGYQLDGDLVIGGVPERALSFTFRGDVAFLVAPGD